MDVLCVVGMSCSGKSVVSNKAKQLGIYTITWDEIIREELQRRGMVYTWRNEAKIDNWFHENQRDLMRRIIGKITELKDQEKLVIEGFKTPEQINNLKERLSSSHFSTLAIHTPPKIREKREKDRRNYHIDGYLEVGKRDKIDMERGLTKLIAMADHMIINDEDLMSFRETVKDKLIDILNIDVKR
ncbi:MAG: AAA family ATPase [Candidatus Aenigmarchaeota archaeon]|nr:AAA family ATPase [Candidatus Aenigmarchaeota archaeon]